MRQAQLYPAIREEIVRLLNAYIEPPQLVAPGLGERSGICGALALAQEAA